jgi:hypothetical protein
MTTTARLQQACATGEIFLHESTFDSLPPRTLWAYTRQFNFRHAEAIGSLPTESRRGKRRRIVPRAPWEQDWASKPNAMLNDEFNIGLSSVMSIREELDSLFNAGIAQKPSATFVIQPQDLSKAISEFSLTVNGKLEDSLARSRWRWINSAIKPNTYEKPSGVDSDYYWVVDGLDGSRPVRRHRPFCAKH